MDELRTSATPTIGDIPDSWTATRVDLVGTVRTGLARSAERQTGRYATKYLRSANITANGLDLEDVREMDFTPEERVTFRLLPGDILLNEASGSSDRVGRAAIWRGEIEGCCYQNHLIRFRPHAVVPEYALIVFQDYAAAGVFARTARGVGIQHLGASRFAALPFPLPPLAEQGRIAEATNEKLGQIREAASRLHSAVNNLSAQTREIVAAATSGTLLHPPGEEGSNETSSVQTHRPKPEETPGIQTVEPLRFNSIPINWTWTTIGEVGDAKLGRQRSPAHHHGPNMRPYLRVANVLDDRIETSDVLRMNFEPQEAAEYELRAGDILLNEGQSPELAGRAALYRGEVPGACFQNTLIRFRAGASVEPAFALLVFRQYLYSGIFREAARWSTNIAHLGLRRFCALPFPLPLLDDQKRIAEEARRRLEATEDQASAVRVSLANVVDMERDVLTAAVTGELALQDPNDEAADALLSRLGAPPVTPKVRDRGRGDTKQMASKSKPMRRPTDQIVDLAAVLRESGGSLLLPELFRRAGFDRDQTEHVERFYLVLRSQLGVSIRLARGNRENAVLEVSDAD